MRHVITASLLIAALASYALGQGGIGQLFLWIGFACEIVFWIRLSSARREAAKEHR